MRQKFVAQFIPLLKCWLGKVQSGVVVKQYWAISVDQCWLQALQFLVHLIDLLSILLRCNSFAKIQRAVVDQMGSGAPNSDHDPPFFFFFNFKFGFGKCFGTSSQSSC